MWRTSCGERILKGAEAIVFAGALEDLIDEAAPFEFDDYFLGASAFDRLTPGQKASALSIVGKGLLRKDVPAVALTAVSEATIAAIFEHLRNCITFEIDEPECGTNWREQVVAARKEATGENILSPKCDAFEEWDIEVQCLADGILWDADYDDERLFVDQAPEQSTELKRLVGVPEGYFLAIPDDLSREDAEAQLAAELRKVCRSVPGIS